MNQGPSIVAAQREAAAVLALVENSLDLIVEATRQGEILYVSPNVKDVLGFTPEELVRTNVFASVHPDDVAAMVAKFALPTGSGLCRYRHKDGSWRWLETNGREYPASDGTLHRVFIARDVTERKRGEAERKRLEAELHQAEKLSALGLLAGGIAHDFNNLLTAMSAFLGLARMQTVQPEVDESLASVSTAISRGRDLAGQILAFSKAQKQERRLVRLAGLVEEVLQLLRPTLPAATRISTRLVDTGWVLANPIEMHQLLVNLCTNAVQALPSGAGEVQIAVETAFREGSQFVVLTVSDTGHGMDGATRQKIFEPFFTTKRDGGGTGLGLAIVHRIVRDHGAKIEVHSQPDEGTKISVYFAQAPSDAAA